MAMNEYLTLAELEKRPFEERLKIPEWYGNQ